MVLRDIKGKMANMRIAISLCQGRFQFFGF
jgi:hypothetical protein